MSRGRSARAAGRRPVEVIADDVYEWNRPAAGSMDSSITSRKHDSAAFAAEAVLVAIDAWTSVHDEAVRVLADPAHQERIGAAYAERLMRSDFSGPVDWALKHVTPAWTACSRPPSRSSTRSPGRRSRARRRSRRSSARRSDAGTG